MAARFRRYDVARGFTLIELVCCIVLLGVLTAVSAPQFFSSQPFEERGYADEVASALRWAQRVAVLSGCEVSLTVNAAGYTALQRAAAGNGCATAGLWVTPVRRLDGTALTRARPASVVTDPAVEYIFDAQGGMENGARPALAVGPFTLNIDAGSGFVVVQ